MNKTEIADWDDALIETTLRVKSQAERKLTLEVIDLLSEIDRRKLYLKRGFTATKTAADGADQRDF